MNVRDDLFAMERKLWSGGKAEYQRTLDEKCLIAFTEMAGVSSRDEIADQAGANRWQDLEIDGRGFPAADRRRRALDVPRERRGQGRAVRSAREQRLREAQRRLEDDVSPADAAARQWRRRMSKDEIAIRGVLADFTRALHDKDAAAADRAARRRRGHLRSRAAAAMGPEETARPGGARAMVRYVGGPDRLGVARPRGRRRRRRRLRVRHAAHDRNEEAAKKSTCGSAPRPASGATGPLEDHAHAQLGAVRDGRQRQGAARPHAVEVVPRGDRQGWRECRNAGVSAA